MPLNKSLESELKEVLEAYGFMRKTSPDSLSVAIENIQALIQSELLKQREDIRNLIMQTASHQDGAGRVWVDVKELEAKLARYFGRVANNSTCMFCGAVGAPICEPCALVADEAGQV